MPTPFTWPLVPDPTPAPSAGASAAAATPPANPIDAFLGYGIITPFQRDKKNDFANAGGLRLIRSTVSQVLGVKSQSETSQGELPWRPEFGSLLHLLKHRKGRVVADIARVYIRNPIAQWEPRVRVTAAAPVWDRERRAVSIRVRFDVIDENAPGNNVILRDADIDVAL